MKDEQAFRRTKRGNPLYHAGMEGTATSHLLKAKAKATGLQRQQIDFELACRIRAARLMKEAARGGHS